MDTRIVVRSALAASAAALVLVAAACGGGGGSPGVAALTGTNVTSTGSSPIESAGPSAGGAPSGGAHIAMKVDATHGAAFAACMRKNGVPNFPDPNGQGVIQFGSGSGIDPRSPKFQAANETCQKLLPNGGQPTPQQLATMKRQTLAFSACMRAHGVKDFPDPNFSGGGVQMRLGGGPGSDLNPNSQVFQKAQQSCQGLLPGRPKLAGGGSTSSGGK